MGLTRRRLLAGLSCLSLGGCGPPEPLETRRPPAPALRRERPVEAWRQALGPLDDVEPELRARFTDPRDFAPMPPQRPGDWRSVRPEPSQTVADFLASAPNFRVAPRERIALLPLGRFPVDVLVGTEFVGLVRSPPLTDIAALLAAFFAAPADLLPAQPLPETGLPWRAVQGHRQHDARGLLGAFAPKLPADAYAMIALVNVDLFADHEQHYTFGWSTFHDRLAVAGFARLDPSFFGGAAPADLPGTLRRRGLRVAVHEIGHVFGLAHCQTFRCVMNGVADLDELDAIPLRLCPLCLRKLHLVTRLDLRARDEALLAVFEALELPEEAWWLRERTRRLHYVARGGQRV